MVHRGTGRAGARAGALSPRGASPGLLTRRYSVPETIMRKYKLAQQNTESEECAPSMTSRASSPARPAPTACPPRAAAPLPPRLDRELMRRSALLRRLWGRPAPLSPSPSPATSLCTCRGARSLDGSAHELRADWPPPPAPTALVPPPLARPVRSDTDDKEYFSDCTYQSHPAHHAAARPASPTSPRTPAHIDLHFDVSSDNMENDDVNLQRYRVAPPLPAEFPPPAASPLQPPPQYHSLEALSPPYEVLEIVVSETVSSSVYEPEESSPRELTLQSLPPLHPPHPALSASPACLQGLELDQYVSEILVSSLNSLSDQLEQVSASLSRAGGDRREPRLCVIEKEIKVKLQNAGVNTIVHLSPTSNHQIIFGNEELCHREHIPRDVIVSPSPSASPRGASSPSTAPAPVSQPAQHAPRDHNHNETSTTHDSVNRAVLHQIQKLFQEELSLLPPTAPAPVSPPTGASLLVEAEESSDVDEYLQRMRIGAGAGNYAPGLQPVPRLCAVPATDSMEVNTSSEEEDRDAPPSDCTSLVDSLDDPRSPRYLPPRSPRRAPAVLSRSAVDVLDLLPETATSSSPPAPSPAPPPPPRESEAFFVRISEDTLACSPAPPPPRLPDRIRQRLVRRQRRRDLRASTTVLAGAAVGAGAGADADRVRHNTAVRARRRLDKDCMALLNSLLDELIAKTAQDEYRYMRIKHRPDIRRTDVGAGTGARGREHSKRNWKRSAESLDELDSFKITRNGAVRFRRESEALVRGRLALPPATPAPPTAPPPRRVYHKSEIREGSKRIEILEILEYVEESQSSPDSSTDSGGAGRRRSRIPVPVPAPRRARAGSEPSLVQCGVEGGSPPRRRASLPAADMSVQSQAVRFRQIFDMIPEERSSLSLESSTSERHCGTSPPPAPPAPPRRHQLTMTSPLRRSAATSPPGPSLWARVEGSTDNIENIEDGSKTIRASRSASTQYEPESELRAGPEPAPDRAGPEPAPDRAGPEPAPDRAGPEPAPDRAGPEPAPDRAGPEPAPDRAGPEPGRGAPPAPGRVQQPGVGKQKTKIDNKTIKRDRLKLMSHRVGRGKDKTPPPPPPPPGTPPPPGSRSSSSESSGSSLLCALAPRWLTGARRPRPRPRPRPRTQSDSKLVAPTIGTEDTTIGRIEKQRGAGEAEGGAGSGWSVTLCGGTRTALPRDVEMHLRFPTPAPAGSPPATARAAAPAPAPCRAPVPALPPCPCQHCAALPPPPPAAATLTLRNHSTDSSVVATRSTRKPGSGVGGSVGGTGTLPELETYRASRTRTKRSVKTRRACSLHCWLPPSAQQPLRCSNGLSVLGCGIVPELRPTRRRT